MKTMNIADIYLCDKRGDGECSDSAPYVVKVEPHENGPLFTEMHCLLRIGMIRHREDWNLLSHRKYCTILFFILIDQSIIYSYSSTHVYFSVCLNTSMFVCIANDSIYDLHMSYPCKSQVTDFSKIYPWIND